MISPPSNTLLAGVIFCFEDLLDYLIELLVTFLEFRYRLFRLYSLTLSENIINMDRQLPYDISYKTIAFWRNFENGLLWSTFICSILLQIFQIDCVKHSLESMKCFTDLFNFLNYISVIGYGLLYIIVEIIMQPMVANERRKGFIDNSLGSKLLEKPVLNYYDNDSIEIGPYKMLVNCYENCFFTYNITKAMLPQMITKNTILFFLLLTFAYYGIRNNIIAIPFLQLFLSSLFLIELIYHIVFFLKLKNLCDRFKHIFNVSKSTKNKTIQDAVYMVLEYETTLAYNKSPNSNSIYQKLNHKLTEEWNSIKEHYDIR